MNKQEVNAFRVAHGLAPLPATNTRAQKARQNGNRAARAEENRSIKASRSKGLRTK